MRDLFFSQEKVNEKSWMADVEEKTTNSHQMERSTSLCKEMPYAGVRWWYNG